MGGDLLGPNPICWVIPSYLHPTSVEVQQLVLGMLNQINALHGIFHLSSSGTLDMLYHLAIEGTKVLR